MSELALTCPYCGHTITLPRPADYAPRFASCQACGKRFVYEPTAAGANVYTEEGAPTCSHPDKRATEMGASDEE